MNCRETNKPSLKWANGSLNKNGSYGLIIIFNPHLVEILGKKWGACPFQKVCITGFGVGADTEVSITYTLVSG